MTTMESNLIHLLTEVATKAQVIHNESNPKIRKLQKKISKGKFKNKQKLRATEEKLYILEQDAQKNRNAQLVAVALTALHDFFEIVHTPPIKAEQNLPEDNAPSDIALLRNVANLAKNGDINVEAQLKDFKYRYAELMQKAYQNNETKRLFQIQSELENRLIRLMASNQVIPNNNDTLANIKKIKEALEKILNEIAERTVQETYDANR